MTRGKNPKRLPGLTSARVRKLGLDWADLASADSHLGRRFDLPALLGAWPELESAWRRGRFLRGLRALAASAATVAESAPLLELSEEELNERIAGDIEVAGIWNEARLATAVAVKGQWLAKAKEGHARAMAQVESALRDEIARAALDIHAVDEETLCEIAGVTRMTLSRWRTSEGLPRHGGDGTYDLPAVWAWQVARIKRQGAPAGRDVDPLRAAKAQREALQNAELEGRLWDRPAVLAGLAERAGRLAEALSAVKAAELGRRLDGQPAPEISRILEAFFAEARASAGRLGEELKLPAAARAAWEQLIATLETGKKGS